MVESGGVGRGPWWDEKRAGFLRMFYTRKATPRGPSPFFFSFFFFFFDKKVRTPFVYFPLKMV